MARHATINRLERTIWILVYGGLLALILGLVLREVASTLSHVMVVGGVIVALVGVALIFVRARMHDDG